MRVIAGLYRSRRLQSRPGLDLRPTADRLRETLFNVLAAGRPQALAGSVWLDLFAGTGAVGIEALSRGAAMVCFVDSSKASADLVRRNLASLGIAAHHRVLERDAEAALRALAAEGFAPDYVFLDPPYRQEEAYARTLGALAGSPLVSAGTLVIAEHSKKFDPGERHEALARVRKLVQGDAGLSFYRKER